jgi:transcriptional regulator with XRE-family HTH domain
MSTSARPIDRIGLPELTALGRQLEAISLERGLSKQALARHAGTSRQQLWRVMTGKSELTSSLCERLAEVLGIDSRALRYPEAFADAMTKLTAGASRPEERRGQSAADAIQLLLGEQADASVPVVSLLDYLADPASVQRTLATLPIGSGGRQLKRRLLDAIEDAAAEGGVKLPTDFFTLRGRVLNGEL